MCNVLGAREGYVVSRVGEAPAFAIPMAASGPHGAHLDRVDDPPLGGEF